MPSGRPPSAPRRSRAPRASRSTRRAAASRQSDAAQRDFVRQAYQREIDDTAAYDLVLSPLALGLPAAAAAVLAAARAKLEL